MKSTAFPRISDVEERRRLRSLGGATTEVLDQYTAEQLNILVRRIEDTSLRVIMSNRRPEDIPKIESGIFEKLLDIWRLSSGSCEEDILNKTASVGLGHRTAVVDVSSIGGLFWDFIGDGFQFYGKAVFEQLKGRPIEAQPDKVYGDWLLENYHAILSSRVPNCSLIDAIIEDPDRGFIKSEYSRLVLPWRKDGKLFLTITSKLRSSFVAYPKITI